MTTQTHFDKIESPKVRDTAAGEDASDGPVVVIKKKTATSTRKKVSIFFTALLFVATVTLIYLYVAHFSSDAESKSNPDDLQNYVLPNTSLVLIKVTETSITGEFTVKDTTYDFASFENALSFRKDDSVDNVLEGSWSGFTVTIEHEDSVMALDFFALNGTVFRAEFAEGTTEAPTVLAEFMADPMMEHYVEMTVKLASNGYLGANGSHIADLYRFAQWIWRFEDSEGEWTDTEMGALSEEFEKLNAIVDASNRAGHWVTNMDELLTLSSNETTINEVSNGGRNLLGSCGSPSARCGNPCFGRCGPDCTCWSWICGNCECWDGCYEHDSYCSCKSIFDFWCVNIFWIRC